MKTKSAFLFIALTAVLGAGMLMAFKQESVKSVIYIRVVERGKSDAFLPMEPAIYITENGKFLNKIELEKSIDSKLIANYEKISSTLMEYFAKGYELKSSLGGSYTIGAINNPFIEYILIKN